ncbi:MAG TPA: GTPase Era [Terriglobales bacterium]|nr:GTPase Era [Terriglobales bacterium]
MAKKRDFRSGFVAVLGRPNVGKSTLVNALVERKVAIVTPHPQTTRTHLLGIVDVRAGERHPAGQIVLVDSPGIHKAGTPYNRQLLRHVRDALEGRDLALLVMDVTRPAGSEDAFALELLRQAGSAPAILVLNKIDRLKDKSALLPIIADCSRRFAFAEIVPVSALTGEQIPALVAAILAHLPSAPRQFPQGTVTDQTEQFWISEVIREKAMLATRQELPHALAVRIEAFELEPKPRIAAVIVCERPGQKAILIGKGGDTIKRIGTEARPEIEELLGERLRGRNLFLQLRVEVRAGWRADETFLRQLDWRTSSPPPRPAGPASSE